MRGYGFYPNYEHTEWIQHNAIHKNVTSNQANPKNVQIHKSTQNK